MKADTTATRARRFKDPKSYVAPDGSEVLHGEDWDDRRFELLQRSRGQCEYVMTSGIPIAFGETYPRKVRCQREAADPHHIVLRSTKRDDRLANLLAVCRHHHNVLDREQRRAKVDAKQARRSAEASQ